MNSTLPNEKSFYHFDDITVDHENFHLWKNGQKIALTPRAFDVLLFLLQNGGRVVEKKEIFDWIWKDTFVGDNALTKIIKEIRRAIADDAGQPRYIETIPKRGYRFIAKVEKRSGENLSESEKSAFVHAHAREDAAAAQTAGVPQTGSGYFSSKTAFALPVAGLTAITAILALWLLFANNRAESTPPPIRSIAVLPFKPLNADSRDESLEMGMAETLITRLSSLKQVVVRPISAVRKYTDVNQDPVQAGREIRAEAVVEGSIQKAGERIRITVRLIDVSRGASLWSEQFDENFTDIFKVQDSIAERITNAITLKISSQEKEQLTKHFTDNPEAYQLYLRGQLLWHRRQENWIEKSLQHFQQALEKDPNFALAYIGAADCYIMLHGHHKMPAQEAETKARINIMKALEIDDTLAQGHNALAELKYQYEYDWTGAEREFKTAIELNPNIAWIRQAYGWFLMSAGRFDEAAAQMEKAGELDPNSLTINVGRGRLLYFSRQYERAIRHFQNILAVEPNESSAYFSLFTIYEQNRMYAEAVEIYLKNMSPPRARPEMIEEFRETFRLSGWQGFLRKRVEISEQRAKTGKIDFHNLANLYARLGEKDKAFAHLEKMFERRAPSIIQFKVEPAYDNLRDDPRYPALLRKIGLQP